MEIEPLHCLPDDSTPREDLTVNWTFPALLDYFAFEDYPFTSPYEPLPPVTASAFVDYERRRWDANRDPGRRLERRKSVHVRMVEFLKTIPMTRAEAEGNAGDSGEGRNDRCFRHMMRERQRRERLSQSYADLYAMVPAHSKPDKNSIVRSTTEYLQELKAKEGELRRRNVELRGRVREGAECSTIRLRVGNPTSSLDSMIGALHCLKDMDVKARSIVCRSSDRELAATIAIETKRSSKEVERAVQGVLVEVEKRVRETPWQRSTVGWSGAPSRIFHGPWSQ